VLEKSKAQVIECRAADLLEPGMDKLKAELTSKGLPATDEAAVLYAMFPQQTEAVYKGTAKPEEPKKKAAPVVVSSAPAASAAPAIDPNAKVVGNASRLALTVNGKRHEVSVQELA